MESSLDSTALGCVTLKEQVERLRREFSKEKQLSTPRERERVVTDHGGYTTGSSVGPYTSEGSRCNEARGRKRGGSVPVRKNEVKPPFMPVGPSVGCSRHTSVQRRAAVSGTVYPKRTPGGYSSGEARYAAPTQRVLASRVDRLERDMKEMKQWKVVVDEALRRRLTKQKQLVQQVMLLSREADTLSCEQEQIRAHVRALEEFKAQRKRELKTARKRKPHAPTNDTTVTSASSHDTDTSFTESNATSLTELLSDDAVATRHRSSDLKDLKRVYSWMK